MWSSGVIAKARIASLLPLVGRIEVPSSPTLPYAGTGFVVGKGPNRDKPTCRPVIFSRPRAYHSVPYGDAAIDFKR